MIQELLLLCQGGVGEEFPSSSSLTPAAGTALAWPPSQAAGLALEQAGGKSPSAQAPSEGWREGGSQLRAA